MYGERPSKYVMKMKMMIGNDNDNEQQITDCEYASDSIAYWNPSIQLMPSFVNIMAMHIELGVRTRISFYCS